MKSADDTFSNVLQIFLQFSNCYIKNRTLNFTETFLALTEHKKCYNGSYEQKFGNCVSVSYSAV